MIRTLFHGIKLQKLVLPKSTINKIMVSEVPPIIVTNSIIKSRSVDSKSFRNRKKKKRVYIGCRYAIINRSSKSSFSFFLT